MKCRRIAIDTSKHVFTRHGVDEQDRPVLRRDLKRHQVEPFFAKLPPAEVALEACGGSHHWGRMLLRLGHQVRLIPPQSRLMKATSEERRPTACTMIFSLQTGREALRPKADRFAAVGLDPGLQRKAGSVCL